MSSDAIVRRPLWSIHEMVDMGIRTRERIGDLHCDVCDSVMNNKPVAQCFCLFYVVLVFCSERCQRIHLTEPDDMGVMGHDPELGNMMARMYREEEN